jgi:hypothetical protein
MRRRTTKSFQDYWQEMTRIRGLPTRFLIDKSGMSRIDCLSVQLIVVILVGSVLYLFKDQGNPPGDGTRLDEPSSTATATTDIALTYFGMPVLDIVLWLLCAVGAIFVLRLVIEVRG